jgi:hypothetical protein
MLKICLIFAKARERMAKRKGKKLGNATGQKLNTLFQ